MINELIVCLPYEPGKNHALKQNTVKILKKRLSHRPYCIKVY